MGTIGTTEITEVSISKFRWDKGIDLFLIVSDLHVSFVDDDRSFEYRRILDDEIDKLIGGHTIDIDLVFLNYLGSFGNDIVGAIIASKQQQLDFFTIKEHFKNILLNKLDVVILEILFDFSTAGTPRTCINNNHD